MKESEFYKTVVQENLVDDDHILELIFEEEPEQLPKEQTQEPVVKSPHVRQNRGFSWRRMLEVTVAVLAAAIVLVAAIPTARAEVLSWFGFSRPDEYLAATPDERDPIEELDALITSAAPADTEVKVTYAIDEPLWQEVAKDFHVTLGDAMYDGESLYQVIDFAGISGIGVYENEWGGEWETGIPIPGLTLEPLDGNMAFHFFEDNADTSMFESGAVTYWMGTSNFIVYELPDGTKLNGWVWMQPRKEDQEFFAASERSQDGMPDSSNWPMSEEQVKAFNEATLDHLSAHGLRAVANVTMWADGEKYPGMTREYKKALANADENGIVSAKVSYEVFHDLGDKDQLKFTADLGTVQIDLNAFRSIPEKKLVGDRTPTEWSGEQTFTGSGWKDQISYVTNYHADMAGVRMRGGTGKLNILGIHGLNLAISYPKEWTKEMRYAFARNLDFKVEIDGQEERIGSMTVSTEEDGSRISINISEIPFDVIRTMKTVRLIPYLSYETAVQIKQQKPVGADGPEVILKTILLGESDTFSSESLDPDTFYQTQGERVMLEQFAVTFTVE